MMDQTTATAIKKANIRIDKLVDRVNAIDARVKNLESPPDPAPEPEPEPEPEPTPTPTGKVLFKSDFESGFKGWYVQSIKERATIVPSSQGGSAARFEVRPGDAEPDTGSPRSEVSGPTFDEGQELYIRDDILIPSGVTIDGEWQIIQQLHDDPWSGSPAVAVFLDEGPIFRIAAGDGSPRFWESGKLQFDRWYKLVYRVKLSRDPKVGLVEVWLDGQRLGTYYGQTIQAPHTYLKAGIYRSKSHTGTSIILHDNIIVGTSLDAVT